MPEMTGRGGAAEGSLPLWPEIVTPDMMAEQYHQDLVSAAELAEFLRPWTREPNKRHIARLLKDSQVNPYLLNAQPGESVPLRNPSNFDPSDEVPRTEFDHMVRQNLSLVMHGIVERAVNGGALDAASYALPVIHFQRSLPERLRVNGTGRLQSPRLELFPVSETTANQYNPHKVRVLPEQSRAFLLGVDNKVRGVKNPTPSVVRGLILAVEGNGSPVRDMRAWFADVPSPEKSQNAWHEAGMAEARTQYEAR